MKDLIQSVTQVPPQADRPHGFLWVREVDRLLRGDATQLAALKEGGLTVPSDRLQLAIVLLGMGYGLCMGTFGLLRGESAFVFQFIAGMVKVPALFLLTLLVTFPSLYVFNSLVGSRLSAVALWRLLTSSVALTMAVLASFGPIVAFFSLSSTSYSFMLLLNVFMFGIAGFLGLKFLLRTLHRLTISQGTPDPVPPVIAQDSSTEGPLDASATPLRGRQVKLVFGCWIMAFAMVGAQMGWLLRPFIGCPNQPFSFFRARESNFFEAVWHHLTHLMGG
jgi:hypothetical protein